MEDPNIVWREGKPDYTQANMTYMEGRTKHHKEGSLEKIVENLVKTWEMEGSHKTRLEVRFYFFPPLSLHICYLVALFIIHYVNSFL